MKIIQFIFYVVAEIRIKLFQNKILKTHTFEIPIISIGNIAMGGTGKTPMTSWLVEYLQSIGKKPCIVTRGYNRVNNKMIIVNPGEKKSYSVQDLGDEPFSLWKKHLDISMVVGKNKIKAIDSVVKLLDCDVVILDDGFQSLYIKRDLDIVMINAQQPTSFMREKVSSLKRSDIVVFKNFEVKSSPIPQITSTIKQWGGLQFITKNIVSCNLLENFQGSLFAVCGIADPSSFMGSLEKNKISINGFLHYGDHHNYSNIDIKNIIQQMKAKNSSAIITTSKDYYKLEKIKKHDIKIFVLDYKIEFIDNQIPYNNQSEFIELINKTINER